MFNDMVSSQVCTVAPDGWVSAVLPNNKPCFEGPFCLLELFCSLKLKILLWVKYTQQSETAVNHIRERKEEPGKICQWWNHGINVRVITKHFVIELKICSTWRNPWLVVVSGLNILDILVLCISGKACILIPLNGCSSKLPSKVLPLYVYFNTASNFQHRRLLLH